jgi:hypothetical protein
MNQEEKQYTNTFYLGDTVKVLTHSLKGKYGAGYLVRGIAFYKSDTMFSLANKDKTHIKERIIDVSISLETAHTRVVLTEKVERCFKTQIEWLETL